MAKIINIEVQGLDALDKRFEKLINDYPKVVDDILVLGANSISADAKRYVPKDTLKLRNSIAPLKIGDLEYKVYTNVKYAPYQEFGTGTGVVIPSGFENIAARFRGSGGRNPNIKGVLYLWRAWYERGFQIRRDLENALKVFIK